MAQLFSDTWARAVGELLSSSETYQTAARTWEGAIVFQLEAAPNQGIAEDRAVYLDLWHGECRAARAATPDDLEHAAFIISGDAATWQQVLSGRSDPLTTLMRGKLKLKKGSLATLTRYVGAAKALVHVSQQVETDFPEAQP